MHVHGWQIRMSKKRDLFFVGQRWVHKLAIQDAGALCVWRQQPDDKSNLQLEIKRKPEEKNIGYVIHRL